MDNDRLSDRLAAAAKNFLDIPISDDQLQSRLESSQPDYELQNNYTIRNVLDAIYKFIEILDRDTNRHTPPSQLIAQVKINSAVDALSRLTVALNDIQNTNDVVTKEIYVKRLRDEMLPTLIEMQTALIAADGPLQFGHKEAKIRLEKFRKDSQKANTSLLKHARKRFTATVGRKHLTDFLTQCGKDSAELSTMDHETLFATAIKCYEKNHHVSYLKALEAIKNEGEAKIEQAAKAICDKTYEGPYRELFDEIVEAETAVIINDMVAKQKQLRVTAAACAKAIDEYLIPAFKDTIANTFSRGRSGPAG